MSNEQIQEEHFDRLSEKYAAHYNDKYSLKYRYRFMYDPMFEGINLADCKVLEAMCGSGGVTSYLIEKGAEVTGLDISQSMVDSYQKKWPKLKALRGSILDSKFDDKSFDVVVIFLGLHHLHPNIDKAILEVHRVLKDGGYFCFLEPHAGAFPDIVRKCWYRLDKNMFAEGEAAINLEECKRENASRFKVLKESYGGNIAYLLVFSSMIFRIPLSWKRLYSDFLIWLESIIEVFQGKRFSCFAHSQWQKIPERK